MCSCPDTIRPPYHSCLAPFGRNYQILQAVSGRSGRLPRRFEHCLIPPQPQLDGPQTSQITPNLIKFPVPKSSLDVLSAAEVLLGPGLTRIAAASRARARPTPQSPSVHQTGSGRRRPQGQSLLCRIGLRGQSIGPSCTKSDACLVLFPPFLLLLPFYDCDYSYSSYAQND